MAAALERTIALPAEARSAGAARRFVTEFLTSTGHDEWLEAAELAVSEIVTNAVLHAHTAFTLTAVIEPQRLRVDVLDQSPTLPVPRAYGESATTGRGMALVAAVTSTHGVTSLGKDGKIVWFTLGDAAAEPDINDLLDAWGDEDTAVSVTLKGLPPLLWLAAREHHDALLRELALIHGTGSVPDTSLALADQARRSISQALDATLLQHAEVPLRLDVTVSVEPGAGASFAVLQDVLDEAEALAASERLLARPGLPEIVALRDWACEQVITQLAGNAAGSWLPTDELSQQVREDALTSLDWDPSVIAQSTRGAVAVDEANRILAVSRPFADALGWEIGDLVGRRVVVLVPERLREAHVAGFTRHLATGEAHVLGVAIDLPVLRPDGAEVTCHFVIEATPTGTGRSVYTAWITPA